jgi:lysozyme
MTPNRKVIDISHHNTVEDVNAVKMAGVLGVIHKATEGTGYVDPNYAPRKNLFAGLLWGAYHFVHPGQIEAQVDHFLQVTGLHDDMLYALDWETSSTGVANQQEATAFLKLLEAKTGRKGVVYSGNVAKEKIKGADDYIGSHRLWLAQYSALPKVQKSWKTWWLWQYSDGEVGPEPHGCPGVSGYVDTNSWADTDDQLKQQWSGIAPLLVLT